MQLWMYLRGQFCQGSLTILSGRAVVSTETLRTLGVVSTGAHGSGGLLSLLQAQAAAGHFCVLGLPRTSLGHRLVLLLQHPPGLAKRAAMARCTLSMGRCESAGACSGQPCG